MTVAPQYPLEHSHLGDENPFEIVTDSRWGAIERWRLNGLLTGEVGALRALSDHIKNDAVSALDELEQRERTVSAREARCDQHERELAATAARLGDEIDRVAAHQEKLEQARADQEREQEPLPAPPDQPDDPPPGADAAAPGDPSDPDKPADDTHIPTGDFHTLPAKDPEQQGHPGVEHDARGEFLRLGDADPATGGAPPSVPLSYVHSRDEVEFPSGELPPPPTEQPPIAAGLDAGD